MTDKSDKKQRSHEDILADLHARRDGVAEGSADGDVADMSYLTQQITAHETLMRLEGEREELVKEKLPTLPVDAQIRFWRTMADPDPFGSAKTVASINPGAAVEAHTAVRSPAVKSGKKDN